MPLSAVCTGVVRAPFRLLEAYCGLVARFGGRYPRHRRPIHQTRVARCCYCGAKDPGPSVKQAPGRCGHGRRIGFDPRRFAMPRTQSSQAYQRWLAILAALMCALGVTGFSQLSAHAAPPAPGSTSGLDVRPFEHGEEVSVEVSAPKSNAPSRVPAVNVPRPVTATVAQNPSVRAAEGLSLRDQRDSDSGNAFPDTPPDQAICVNSTQVIEGVNSVFSIYDKATGR